MKMLKKFLKSDLSAAGISHTVTSKSVFRRVLWVVALLMISAVMMSMTYEVLQEYLEYPTVMHMKRSSLKLMEFPAVTVCSHNLIPRHNHKESDLQHMEDMELLLKALPRFRMTFGDKIRCMKDPLCRWSRFLEKCFCARWACKSTACYPNVNESACTCSQVLCLPSISNVTYGCSIVKDGENKDCVCKRDFEYPLYTPKTSDVSEDFLEALKNMKVSPRVELILKLIKNSNLTLLRDVRKFMKPNITTRDNYGISYENLILSCTFGSRPCNISRDVSTLYSPSFGKCYMFNYAGEENKDAEVKVVRHPGKTNGLQLLLKNPKSNAFPLFSAHYGARVVVHEPRSMPFAAEYGFDIRSGDVTSAVVQYREVHRLGPPWNDCAWDGDNQTSSYIHKPYSMLGCERNCLVENVFKRCGCYHDRFFSGTLTPIRVQLCITEKQDKCAERVFKDKNRQRIHCHCPPPCRENRYKVTISAGKVNRDFFRIVKKSRTLKMVNGEPAVAHPEFKLGIMALHVYFGSFAVLNNTESSTYSWEFLVANVGGNLGLFLGLSLITFVEIAEFIVDVSAQTFLTKNLCSKKRIDF